ncbi:MAG: hypothetical protein AAGI23_09405 [Bacteroidota bacterium]
MKYYILSVFLFVFGFTQAQSFDILAAEYDNRVSVTPPGAGTYGMNGFFEDADALGYTISDIIIDSTRFEDAVGNIYIIRSTAGSSPIQIGVDYLSGNGDQAPATGYGTIYNPTKNFDFPLETFGITGKSRSIMERRYRVEVDSLLNRQVAGGGTCATTVTGTGLSVGDPVTLGNSGGATLTAWNGTNVPDQVVVEDLGSGEYRTAHCGCYEQTQFSYSGTGEDFYYFTQNGVELNSIDTIEVNLFEVQADNRMCIDIKGYAGGSPSNNGIQSVGSLTNNLNGSYTYDEGAGLTDVDLQYKLSLEKGAGDTIYLYDYDNTVSQTEPLLQGTSTSSRSAIVLGSGLSANPDAEGNIVMNSSGAGGATANVGGFYTIGSDTIQYKFSLLENGNLGYDYIRLQDHSSNRVIEVNDNGDPNDKSVLVFGDGLNAEPDVNNNILLTATGVLAGGEGAFVDDSDGTASLDTDYTRADLIDQSLGVSQNPSTEAAIDVTGDLMINDFDSPTTGQVSFQVNQFSGTVNSDVFIQNNNAGRTRFFNLPGIGNNISVQGTANDADFYNSAFIAKGARGQFGFLQIDQNGTPSQTVNILAVELDPRNLQSDSEFIITTDGFNGGGTDANKVVHFRTGDTGTAMPQLGIYDDDTAAASAGVDIGELYELSTTNTYSLPAGILKTRRQ